MMIDAKNPEVSPNDQSICSGSMRASETKSMAELAFNSRSLMDKEQYRIDPVYLKNGKAMRAFTNPSNGPGGLVDSSNGKQFLCIKGWYLPHLALRKDKANFWRLEQSWNVPSVPSAHSLARDASSLLQRCWRQMEMEHLLRKSARGSVLTLLRSLPSLKLVAWLQPFAPNW